MKTFLALAFLVLPVLGIADTVVPVDEVETYVNIRKSPQAGAVVVGRLQQGASLPLVASADGWNEVQLDSGESGFISADWTVVVADEPVVVIEAEPAPEPEQKVAPEPVAEPEMVPEPETAPEPATEEQAVMAEESAPVVEATPELPAVAGRQGPMGPAGPAGPAGPQGPAGDGAIKGDPGYIVKFKDPTVGTSSQIFDNGNQVGIGTAEPKQRLEVNGNIQIHERNSGIAGLMITQSSGETGYVMHNRASTLTIGAGSVDRITIDRDGNVGIGESKPSHPLQLASGAHATSGGVWTNSSSRAKKENISALELEDALATLASLEPVHFNYKSDAAEAHIGFIAEDVPDLVATVDRQGLSTMDIVAVLTRVIQAQQQQIDALESRFETLD